MPTRAICVMDGAHWRSSRVSSGIRGTVGNLLEPRPAPPMRKQDPSYLPSTRGQLPAGMTGPSEPAFTGLTSPVDLAQSPAAAVSIPSLCVLPRNTLSGGVG